MKKAITLILISLISFSINAQNLLQLKQMPQININNINDSILNPLLVGNPASYVPQTIKQRLDSLTGEEKDPNTMQWSDSQKTIYTYDAQENISKITKYSDWDDITSQWLLKNTEDYTYHSNGNLASYIYKKYENAIEFVVQEENYNSSGNLTLKITRSHINTGEVYSGSKQEYTYDNTGNNIILNISHDWLSGQWVPMDKYEYNYDTDNKLIFSTDYTWDDSTDDWVQAYQSEYTYNADGHLVLVLHSDLPLDMPHSKLEYTYDTNNNVTLIEYFEWLGGGWLLQAKDEYDYDANNNQTLCIDYYRMGDQFVPNRKYEYAYNSNTLWTLYNSMVWDIDIGQWEGIIRSEYTYDTNDNYVQFLTYRWDTSNNQWRYYFRSNFNYDNNYPHIELLVPFTESYFKHKQIDYTYDSWDITNEQWILESHRGTYHYSEQLVGVENVVQAGIQVFPNPATNQVFFSLPPTNQIAHIQLYDAQGKLTDIQQLDNNKISVKHLNTGIYFYKLFHNDRQYGGQLMVR